MLLLVSSVVLHILDALVAVHVLKTGSVTWSTRGVKGGSQPWPYLATCP